MNKKQWIAGLLATAMLLTSTPVSAASKYTWPAKKAPNYVVKVGKAKITTKVKKGKVKYAKLDKYGRAGAVTAKVTYKMIKKSAGWRQDIPESEAPAGWGYNRYAHIKLYNGRIYNGYLYNRSHLLADSLGGKPIRRNLVTGTRTQNVGANDGKGGMAYTEQKTLKYIKNHKKVWAYYKANPVYKGSELLPRSVIVDVRTSDKKINMRVIVYNAAKGYKINYKTGNSTGNGTSQRASTVPAPKPGSNSNRPTPSKTATVYITATGSKYHSTSNCRGLSHAKSITPVTLSEAQARGLTPCDICY